MEVREQSYNIIILYTNIIIIIIIIWCNKLHTTKMDSHYQLQYAFQSQGVYIITNRLHNV